MLVRRESAADLEAIDDVHRRAFAMDAGPGVEPVEVGLVHALRAEPAWVPALSLVAVRDDCVIGHVVVTRASIAGGRRRALALWGSCQPTRVPAWVRLMHAVLGAADALDITVVALLGHTGYYPGFGFVPASDLGIAAPDPEWGAHFQARPLATWNAGIGGKFRYAAPFNEL